MLVSRAGQSVQTPGDLGRVFKWLLLSSLADHHIRTIPVTPPWAWQACCLQRGLPPVILQRLQDRPWGQQAWEGPRRPV